MSFREGLRSLWGIVVWLFFPSRMMSRFEEALERSHEREAELYLELMENFSGARMMLEDRREFNRQQLAAGKITDAQTGEWS